MAAARVAQLLQKLSGAPVSARDRLVSCQVVAETLPTSPDALASFSSHKGVQVLLQQLGHSSTSTSLLTSILQSLTYTFEADRPSAQANEAQFWLEHGEVMVTEAVSFVLAGDAESEANGQTLSNYIAFLALLAQHGTAEQQMQLLRVNQGVLKQAAQIMQDSAEFQQSLLQLLQQLLQVDSAFHIDALEVLKCSKILRSSARAVKVYGSLPPVINSAVRLLTTLLNEYKMSTCFDALAEEIIDSGLPLEIEIAIKNSQDGQEGAPVPNDLQLEAALAAQQHLQEWQAQHKDFLHTDIMQAMDESSDSESAIAESPQVFMHAHSSSLGSFHSPHMYDDQGFHEQGKQKEIQESQPEEESVHKNKGLFSLLTRALKRR